MIPWGLVVLVTLKGKIIFRETCEEKSGWDALLPKSQAIEYNQWVKALPKSAAIPRALTTQREAVEEIELHSFGDASKRGMCAALYAVMKQNKRTKVAVESPNESDQILVRFLLNKAVRIHAWISG